MQGACPGCDVPAPGYSVSACEAASSANLSELTLHAVAAPCIPAVLSTCSVLPTAWLAACLPAMCCTVRTACRQHACSSACAGRPSTLASCPCNTPRLQAFISGDDLHHVDNVSPIREVQGCADLQDVDELYSAPSLGLCKEGASVDDACPANSMYLFGLPASPEDNRPAFKLCKWCAAGEQWFGLVCVWVAPAWDVT